MIKAHLESLTVLTPAAMCCSRPVVLPHRRHRVSAGFAGSWIDRTACDNAAVAAGWLVANRLPENEEPEWVEAGVTKGHFLNVGCVAVLSTYYAFNNAIGGMSNYQEYLVANGRVDL